MLNGQQAIPVHSKETGLTQTLPSAGIGPAFRFRFHGIRYVVFIGGNIAGVVVRALIARTADNASANSAV